ncbi:hypothetical protein ERO13_D09G144800v2 [Gossypium hirsutum]|uniref:Uncharacterized protein n=5 Tax=Gossypium TaxID=3633 RepID=A0A0D2RXK2_GOSRA|nr:hypothetical protein ES319_D09G163100v1 [Gossypium barbadense]KAG4130454.1 hypothetical protein ERO13_D09G144800v2 [Gossypium hirsutum]KJB36584.1 hypothetical protein B456_006G166100 [Gossypium raimondii]TYG54314.1 hypothetical protein ES288_D09G179100v1 [Gossypium darwinii]TYI65609.1 hypothetical protein E1A91_D09G168700v1 [Gossypium mustelinum]
MGFVLVISFPLLLLVLILALAFYLLGRAQGRRERPAQYFGPPVPPPGSVSASSPPTQAKPSEV